MKSILFTLLGMLVFSTTKAQLKNYTITASGDTLNALNAEGKRVGKWVIKVPGLREEPGYEEEGAYNKQGEKEGIWRRYNEMGDLLAIENYQRGDKAGTQQYFTYLGALEHDELWMPYDPEDPYDTVPIYGTNSNEILEYKIVRAVPYSVKEGEWHYYDPGTGKIIRTEVYEHNRLIKPIKQSTAEAPKREKPQKVEKTKEMLEWEKKNKGKKVIDGSIGF